MVELRSRSSKLKNISTTSIYNNFIKKPEALKKYFEDLEEKLVNITPEKKRKLKEKLENKKTYCKKKYLTMISVYEYNLRIFNNKDLKKKFINLMKILKVKEPEYLNYNYIFSDYNKDIKKALSTGLNPNIQDVTGETPLHIAIHENRPIEIIKLLIDKGADPNIQSKIGGSALHYATANSKSKEIIELLIKKGADLNIQDKTGYTPLHLAIEMNSPKQIIKLLIDKGAKLNIKNKYGDTPLHLAIIKKNSKEIIKLLIDKNASLNIKNKNGKTPLKLAEKIGSSKVIIELLNKN